MFNRFILRAMAHRRTGEAGAVLWTAGLIVLVVCALLEYHGKSTDFLGEEPPGAPSWLGWTGLGQLVTGTAVGLSGAFRRSPGAAA